MGGPMREWIAARSLRMMPSQSGDSSSAAATFSKQSRKLLMSQAVIAPLRAFMKRPRLRAVAALYERRSLTGGHRPPLQS